MSSRTSLTLIITLAIACSMLVGYNALLAQWSPAPGTPPANNTPAPINVGAAYQQKAGDLGALKMRANEYCNLAGDVCFTAEDVGMSTTTINNSTTTVTNPPPPPPPPPPQDLACEVRFISSVHGRQLTTYRIVPFGGFAGNTGAVGVWTWRDSRGYDARFTGEFDQAAWDSSLFQSSQRAGSGYYTPQRYQEQLSWLNSVTPGVLRIATFPMSPGASAVATHPDRGGHSVSATVLNCGSASQLRTRSIVTYNRTQLSSFANSDTALAISGSSYINSDLTTRNRICAVAAGAGGTGGSTNFTGSLLPGGTSCSQVCDKYGCNTQCSPSAASHAVYRFSGSWSTINVSQSCSTYGDDKSGYYTTCTNNTPFLTAVTCELLR